MHYFRYNMAAEICQYIWGFSSAHRQDGPHVLYIKIIVWFPWWQTDRHLDISSRRAANKGFPGIRWSLEWDKSNIINSCSFVLFINNLSYWEFCHCFTTTILLHPASPFLELPLLPSLYRGTIFIDECYRRVGMLLLGPVLSVSPVMSVGPVLIVGPVLLVGPVLWVGPVL